MQKAWLRVRNLTARCLVAASRVPSADTPSVSLHHADGDTVNNGETSVTGCDAVKQLSGELATTLNSLSLTYAGHTTNQVI